MAENWCSPTAAEITMQPKKKHCKPMSSFEGGQAKARPVFWLRLPDWLEGGCCATCCTGRKGAAVLRAAPASTIDRSLSGTALRPCTPESRSKPIRKRIIYFLSFPYICLSTLRSQRRRWLSSLRSDLTYQPRPVLCTYCRMLNARLTTIDVMSFST